MVEISLDPVRPSEVGKERLQPKLESTVRHVQEADTPRPAQKLSRSRRQEVTSYVLDIEGHLSNGLTGVDQVENLALAANGTNVRHSLDEARARRNVRDGDELIDVKITGGGSQVILATRSGLAIRFKEVDVRPMGRPTEGVRGIALAGDDQVVGMVVVYPGCTLLVVTEHGMGKRSDVDEYRLQRRGGKGVINLRVTDRTGQVVTIKAVNNTEQLMVMSRNGVVNRQPVEQIRVIGRATQGVRLVSLDEGDLVMDVARVVVENGDDVLEDAATQVIVGSAAVDEGDPEPQESE
mgnify:CR=1 FL=1